MTFDLSTFAAALADLPTLLASPAGWHGLAIDYHPPRVDRAWRAWRDCRLAIHRIYPCAPGEALFHPHPWPSIVHLVTGRYAMNLGRGPGLAPPPIAAHVIASAGTTYAMLDPDAWHDVRPLDAPTLSIMLSGPPWQRAVPVEPEVPLSPLNGDALAALIADAARMMAR